MSFLSFLAWFELAALIAAIVLLRLAPFQSQIDRLFRNRVVISTNHYANGWTVTRAVYAWHGGLVAFAVLESHFTDRPATGTAAALRRPRA